MFDRDEREIIGMLREEGGADAVMGLIEEALKYGEPDSYTESVLSDIYSKLKKIKEES
ncbi:MAG: hypothetical protein IJH51_03705 [Christensenellaceae bacterium]|nr:hypothetical protein [Christensenellaceae bacterium]